jgi:predicted RNA binding protein YcfA (HicA-like mRNA interferase family)
LPKTIRELKSMLQKAGFTLLKEREKGSHTIWEHPNVKQNVILSGKNGKDAQRYQEKRVKAAIEEAKNNE